VAAQPDRPHVLLVEDDEELRLTTRLVLERQGFTVTVAADGVEGLARLDEETPDVALVDVMMPRMDGITFIRQIRARRGPIAELPVIVLTARDLPHDQVAGFDAGADDYVVKPFDGQVLAARLRAVLRRGAAPSADGIRVGDLLIDRPGMSISRGDEPISLSSTEFRLLEAFLDHPSRVLSRGQLLDLVWGDPDWGDPHVVEVNVQRLRSKIGAEHIVTVRGAGYKWVSG
jgi:DNA-binding response OmpR family regulator